MSCAVRAFVCFQQHDVPASVTVATYSDTNDSRGDCDGDSDTDLADLGGLASSFGTTPRTGIACPRQSEMTVSGIDLIFNAPLSTPRQFDLARIATLRRITRACGVVRWRVNLPKNAMLHKSLGDNNPMMALSKWEQ